MKPRNDAIRKNVDRLRHYLEDNGCFIQLDESNQDGLVITIKVRNLKTNTSFEIHVTSKDFKSYEKKPELPARFDILNKPLFAFCFYHTGRLGEFSDYDENLYCEKYKDAEKMASEIIKFYSVKEFKTYIQNKRNELGL